MTYAKAVVFVDNNLGTNDYQQIRASLCTRDSDLYTDELLLASYAPIWDDVEYASTEPNNFTLDGTIITADGLVDYGLVSKKSEPDPYDPSSHFVPGNVMFAFTTPQTMQGITIKFAGIAPQSIDVTINHRNASNTYYTIDNISDNVIRIDDYISDATRVTISVGKSQHYGDYYKLQWVSFGSAFEYENDEIINATISEEIDITSATVPVNTCELTVLDPDNMWNAQNPNGIWKYARKNQRCIMREYVNGQWLDMGTFYITNWDASENVVKFNAISPLGRLEQFQCNGFIVNNELVSEAIHKATGASIGYPTEYYVPIEVDTSLFDKRVTGYIPRGTSKDALQQIAFAIGAVVDDTRDYKIHLVPIDAVSDSYILTNRKFSGETTVALDEYINGISITANSYTPVTETVEVFNGYLEAGVQDIALDEPYNNFSCTGATITAYTSAHVRLNVATAGVVVVTAGVKYDVVENTTTAAEPVERGFVDTRKEYKGLTLIPADGYGAIAQRLLEYWGNRQIVSLEYICENEHAGQMVNIQDGAIPDAYMTTRITAQTLDLTGGFLASAQCRGYTAERNVTLAMGDDLEMGGNEII